MKIRDKIYILKFRFLNLFRKIKYAIPNEIVHNKDGSTTIRINEIVMRNKKVRNYKFFLRPICWLRTFWYTINRPGFWVDGIPIEGCHYVEQKDGKLICKICGKNG